ncbi:hypothetical protein GPECTOR_12g529 [Gonium pectorale]|uniref:Uncharacterized protein n=1 Tax=Gonium pectorale TaxID=33097 RepID=A0A150GNY2_GONPE|nr:hypothetical protein GPECTOR_12g529 [Gonium pectorale]|eukprot:KXZ51566.1 hypothetical protein GPECTOR_12g529 [Gonium pectorale]
MPPRRAAVLLLVGAALMAAGVFLVRGYQYGHLHRRIEEAYFTSAADGAGARKRAAQSSLLDFQASGLLETVFFARASTVGLLAADARRAEHARLWRPVGHDLAAGRSMALIVRDGPTGTESRLDLGRVVFSRERTVPAGGEARCMHDQHGVWEADYTCTVNEYLWGLCVRVARDAESGAYRLDAEPGCGGGGGGGGSGSEAGQWRRLDRRRHSLHGRLHLPLSARNATTVTVKHTRDPSLLEMEAVRRLAPNMEQQILFHAVGMALCFLGFVLLLSVAAFAAPGLLARARDLAGGRRSRRAVRRQRGGGGHGGDKDSGDELLRDY